MACQPPCGAVLRTRRRTSRRRHRHRGAQGRRGAPTGHGRAVRGGPCRGNPPRCTDALHRTAAHRTRLHARGTRTQGARTRGRRPFPPPSGHAGRGDHRRVRAERGGVRRAVHPPAHRAVPVVGAAARHDVRPRAAQGDSRGVAGRHPQRLHAARRTRALRRRVHRTVLQAHPARRPDHPARRRRRTCREQPGTAGRPRRARRGDSWRHPVRAVPRVPAEPGGGRPRPGPGGDRHRHRLLRPRPGLGHHAADQRGPGGGHRDRALSHPAVRVHRHRQPRPAPRRTVHVPAAGRAARGGRPR